MEDVKDGIVLRDDNGRWLAGASGNPNGPRDELGRWAPGASGNQGSPRVRTLRAAARRAIEADLPQIIEAVKAKALAGDMIAARILLDRCLPAQRPDSEPVVIEGLSEAVTLSDKAAAVIAAVARGEVAPEVGERLLIALAACAKVIESDELQRRVTALEEQEEIA